MKTPVVFVHGLWIHADAWKPWADLFRDAGYEPIAPGWPGDGESVADTRAHPERVAGTGIDDVVEHYAGIIRALPAKPIVIGHSFGGLIAQKLLDQGLASAAVAIDAAPIRGVLVLPFSALRVAFAALRNPTNKHRAVALAPSQFRYGFTNTRTEAESSELYELTIPSPGRPLFEAALANFNPSSPARINTRNPDRGPLLLIGGGSDHTVPASITRSSYKLYLGSGAITELKEFPDRDHSLAMNSSWREVADFALSWIKSHAL